MTSVLYLDDFDLDDALVAVSSFGTDRFGYVVTPNVDHVIRHYYNKQFRALYAQASYVLLDSRFLAHTVGLTKRQLFRVCLGSDLTTSILHDVLKPTDVAVLVGGTLAQADTLRAKFRLESLHHIRPPMNLLSNPVAIDACVRDIEGLSPFRFCFLAVGSPQQEIIAQKLKERNVARGLALCVGAAVNFITGVERRAPIWMQQLGLEWLFRLMMNPRRLARRYLLRGPKIFWLLWRIELRLRCQPAQSLATSENPDTSGLVGPAGKAA